MALKRWNDKDETPLMRQYWKIKDKHPNAILLFRMGDFYETFDEDARVASAVLGITLTKRANGKASHIDLAGFPIKAMDTYLPKLVAAGHRVAVCEQVEDPKFAKTVVKRDVVEVVTPGVAFQDSLLSPKRANYLASVVWGDKKWKDYVGIAFADITTGEFMTCQVPYQQANEILQTIQPTEVLFDKRQKHLLQGLSTNEFVGTPQDDWVFGYDFAYESLLKHFKTHSLKGFGLNEAEELSVIAAGATLYYLSETQKGRIPHIKHIKHYSGEQYIPLDVQTKRNLELISSMQDGRQEGTLVQVIDKTLTAGGGRLLRKWLMRPLREKSKIEKRLDALEAFFNHRETRLEIRDLLGQTGDVERLITKVCLNRATPRECQTLSLSLQKIPLMQAQLQGNSVFENLKSVLKPLQELTQTLTKAFADEVPNTVGSGNIFRKGWHSEMDELRNLAENGKGFLAKLQADEVARTGITSLKVGYNGVFGYYLEVTNVHKDKVPPDYIRKQTLTTAERYITPALKEYEEKILSAEEKIQHLETQLFDEIKTKIAEQSEDILHNASILSMIDVFCGLAEVAERNQYVRPVLREDTFLNIVEGRHPVVEKLLPEGEAFIPNSVQLNADKEQIMLITGPNMAGKSVILRQTGLIVLLAQIGAFVPAKSAEIGLVDKIFTRVGASDNLAAGESTFLVEMNETANILNNATAKSLILLDEVGRGTSTFDGLSIAWAMVEYLHENQQVAARTLFATHYHELNELADRFPRIRNFRVQVDEFNGKIIFMRKLVAGGADSSYGIEVAKMAGLPPQLIHRAQEVLASLENQPIDVSSGENKPKATKIQREQIPVFTQQISLFDVPIDTVAQELKSEIEKLDPNRMTPMEALLALAELKRKIEI